MLIGIGSAIVDIGSKNQIYFPPSFSPNADQHVVNSSNDFTVNLTFGARSSTFILGKLNVAQKPNRQSDPAKEHGEFGKFTRLLD